MPLPLHSSWFYHSTDVYIYVYVCVCITIKKLSFLRRNCGSITTTNQLTKFTNLISVDYDNHTKVIDPMWQAAWGVYKR
jgi:hypothetical protein